MWEWKWRSRDTKHPRSYIEIPPLQSAARGKCLSHRHASLPSAILVSSSGVSPKRPSKFTVFIDYILQLMLCWTHCQKLSSTEQNICQEDGEDDVYAAGFIEHVAMEENKEKMWRQTTTVLTFNRHICQSNNGSKYINTVWRSLANSEEAQFSFIMQRYLLRAWLHKGANIYGSFLSPITTNVNYWRI